MKKFLVFLFTALMFSSVSKAQLSAVYFADSATVYAGGTSGLIQKSVDSGATWVKQVSGTTRYIFGMSFSSKSSGWAVGGDPITGAVLVLHTTDGGTWVSQTAATTQPLLQVSFASSTVGIACGYGGTIDITSNGGTTWTSVVTGILTTFNGCYMVNTSTGFIVGDFGVILKTTNGGAAWTSQTSNTGNDLYAVHFASTLAGIAVGAGGKIVRTTNGGTTWTVESSGTTNSLNGITMTDSTKAYAVGNNATIINSTNGGTTWAAQNGGAINYADVSFSPSLVSGVAVGGGTQTISLTRNSGSTWSPPTSGCTIPSIPTLLSPANGVTGIDTTVFFTWSGATCAKKYNLWVAVDNAFGTLVWNDTTSSTSASNTIFQTGTYYWKVRSIGDSGTSAFSSVFTFSTSSSADAKFSANVAVLDFGSVTLGTSSTKYFKITNTGGGTLSISNVTSSNTQYVPQSTSKSISAGITDSVGIKFTPARRNSKKAITGNITFINNTPTSPNILGVTGKCPR